MRKDKVRFSTIVGILLFVSFLVFGFFFLDYKIDQTFTGKTESIGIEKSDINFIDATWHLVDFPGCEDADKENRVMQEIGLVYYVSYNPESYSCDLEIITNYADGKVSTPQSYNLDETKYTFNGFNVFDSYKLSVCCSDGNNRVCQSKVVRNIC
ncbi:MAG: hypothetical protein WC438_05265 [Candidatus Pacearchaeota archaeon]